MLLDYKIMTMITGATLSTKTWIRASHLSDVINITEHKSQITSGKVRSFICWSLKDMRPATLP